MKLEDMRKQSMKELEQQLAKYQEDLAEFNLDIRTKDITNVREGRRLRRDIARLKTIIQEKEQANG